MHSNRSSSQHQFWPEFTHRLALCALDALVGSATLDLSHNELGSETSAELADAFKMIPAYVTILNLSHNQLGRSETSAELALAFEAIPSNVTSLNLSHNQLASKMGAELALAFKAIPSNVSSLDLSSNGLGSKTGAELALAFEAIPSNVSSLDLTSNALENIAGVELALVFEAIPSNVNSLNLSWNYLGSKAGTELALAFNAISSNVTSLNLSHNQLGSKTGAELALAFKAIPSNITSLDLSWNQWGSKTGAELALVFEAIPSNVTSLDLSYNQLASKTGAELAFAFAAIPSNVTSLNLTYNQLASKTGAELALVFEAIPSNVNSLNLSENQLGRSATSAELALAFKAIPSNITSLDLSLNELGSKTGAELALVFEAVPSNVNSLKLSSNMFDCKTGAELAFAFAAIPSNVTSLDLSNTGLGSKTSAELALAFKAISSNVTSLNLSHNQLGSKTGAELALVFEAIPSNVTSLDLSWNQWGSKTGAELALVFGAIPVSINTLIIESGGFIKISQMLINSMQDFNFVLNFQHSISNYFNSDACPEYERQAFSIANDRLCLQILQKHLEYSFNLTSFDAELGSQGITSTFQEAERILQEINQIPPDITFSLLSQLTHPACQVLFCHIILKGDLSELNTRIFIMNTFKNSIHSVEAPSAETLKKVAQATLTTIELSLTTIRELLRSRPLAEQVVIFKTWLQADTNENKNAASLFREDVLVMVSNQLNPDSQMKLNLNEIALHLKSLPRLVIAEGLLNQIILDIKAIPNETNDPHRQAAIEALQAQINQELPKPSASFTKMIENLTQGLRNFKGLDEFIQQLTIITTTSNKASIGNEMTVANIQTLIKSAYHLFTLDPSDEEILKTLDELVKTISNSLPEDHKRNSSLAFFGVSQLANELVSALDYCEPRKAKRGDCGSHRVKLSEWNGDDLTSDMA